MLYLAIGSDFNQRKKKTDTLVAVMQKKRPEAQLLVLDGTSENTVAQLQQQISGIGLFDDKSITKGLGLCEEKNIKNFIFEHLDQMVSSSNAFVFSEVSLTKIEIGKVEKVGGEVFVFSGEDRGPVGNLFYVGDLLLNRNKSKLWVAIQEELIRGISTEEIVGILIWQAKSLHLSKTMSQSASELKPFVYNKCAKSDWGATQASNLHKELIYTYHQSRRGGPNLTERLEQLILDL